MTYHWPVSELAQRLSETSTALGFDFAKPGKATSGTKARKPKAASESSNAPADLMPAPSLQSLLDLLDKLPNGDSFDRQWQLNVAYAVRGAVKGTPMDGPEARKAFLAWSARYPGDPAHDARIYDGAHAPKLSWRYLVDMLSQYKPDAAHGFRFAMAHAVFAANPLTSDSATLRDATGLTQSGVPGWITDINAQYAYVMALDRVVEFDHQGLIVATHTKEAFRTFYNGRSKGAGTDWLASPYARRYTGIGMWEVGQEPPEMFNSWTGLPPCSSWPKVAAPTSLTDPLGAILEFIIGTIASGRTEVADYILNWMAWKLRNVLDAPGTALALIGSQGTGKTTLVEMMIDMVGERYAVTASNERQMSGNFNAHFENKLIAGFEEAFLGRDPRHAGPFKDLVTGTRLHIEGKGRDVRDVPNRLGIMLTSNDASVVPLEPNDRRTTLVRVSNAHRGDAPYFEALRAAWTNGGRELLMAYLLARDLTQFNPRRPLNTPEKAEALAETGDAVVRYWDHILCEGKPVELWDATAAQDWTKGVFMVNSELYDDFKSFARGIGVKYVPSMTEFNRRLDELCPGRSASRPRQSSTGKSGPRGHDYPPLDQCRAAFSAAASSAS